MWGYVNDRPCQTIVIGQRHKKYKHIQAASFSWIRLPLANFFDIPLYLCTRLRAILDHNIVISQLFSTKISVCHTDVIFPRNGVKQGGVLSGVVFAACYDDLAEDLERMGVGVLYKAFERFVLLYVIIYADDVLLIASSPHGLRLLIDTAFLFAQSYNDINFNTSKSWILRLGKHRRPAVSIRGIPVTECQEYLGVEIGRKANPQNAATCKLYSRANLLIAQNTNVNKCSIEVKNVCIYTYGTVYCLENELFVTPKLRQAHRYLTKLAHSD